MAIFIISVLQAFLFDIFQIEHPVTFGKVGNTVEKGLPEIVWNGLNSTLLFGRQLLQRLCCPRNAPNKSLSQPDLSTSNSVLLLLLLPLIYPKKSHKF